MSFATLNLPFLKRAILTPKWVVYGSKSLKNTALVIKNQYLSVARPDHLLVGAHVAFLRLSGT